MPLEKGGLAKLTEEAGELLQIVGKKMAFFYTDKHPDGCGSMQERLEDEIADVAAASIFVREKFELDHARINRRIIAKLQQFREWDRL